MHKMYYHSFPAAPLQVVTAIACVAKIPCISAAYVGTDNSLFLDAYWPSGALSSEQLDDIARVCGVPLEFIFVEPGIDSDHISISLVTTAFDFSDRFKGHPLERYCDARALPGEEDSEEMIEAHLALNAVRR